MIHTLVFFIPETPRQFLYTKLIEHDNPRCFLTKLLVICRSFSYKRVNYMSCIIVYLLELLMCLVLLLGYY